MKNILLILGLLVITVLSACKTTKQITRTNEKLDSLATSISNIKTSVDSGRAKTTTDEYNIIEKTFYRVDTVKGVSLIDSTVIIKRGLIKIYDTSFNTIVQTQYDTNHVEIVKETENYNLDKKTTTPTSTYIIWIIIVLAILFVAWRIFK